MPAWRPERDALRRRALKGIVMARSGRVRVEIDATRQWRHAHPEQVAAYNAARRQPPVPPRAVRHLR